LNESISKVLMAFVAVVLSLFALMLLLAS